MNVIQPKEHPIMFSGEMVRAILDGRKTMTRRMVKAQDRTGGVYADQRDGSPVYPLGIEELLLRCSYGQIGDRLWVRESLRGDGQPGNRRIGIMRYAADGEMVLDNGVPVCPSKHMPRWASRITVEITDIRVERLQEISEEDAIAEGMQKSIGGLWCGAPHRAHGCPKQHNTAVEAFADLWDSLNAKRGYGWDVNPRVWVIEFRRVEA